MRDTSLKASLPVLSKPFALTSTALYGRQLALERAGLLGTRKGKGGPGSGIRLTGHSAAMMLIALLATDSVDAAAAAAVVAKLKSTAGKCPLTGKTTFAEALAAILEDVGYYEIKIRVNRDIPTAHFFYRLMGTDDEEQSSFAPRGKVPTKRPPVAVDVTIQSEALRQFAEAMFLERAGPEDFEEPDYP